MLITICLAIIALGMIVADFLTAKNIKITNETQAVINLRKKNWLWDLLFLALLSYSVISNIINHTIDTLQVTFVIIIIGFIIKKACFNPRRIVVNKKSVNLTYGTIPVEAISVWRVDEKGQLEIGIQNVARRLTFKPAKEQDYQTIIYCAEKLNLGSSQEIIKQHRLAQISAQARGVFPMIGVIKDYDWGGPSFITKTLGLEEKPAAEYWLGTHQSGVAALQIKGSRLNNLAKEFYTKHPEQSRIDINTSQDYIVYLNFNLAYGQPLINGSDEKINELPYLFKVLDVARPLSIQLHPNKEIAEKGYVNEDLLKISLDSPKRTFKDKNHKPELMIALTDFYLLHGFRHKEDIVRYLNGKPALEKLKNLIKENDLKTAYSKIMSFSNEQMKEYFLNHLRVILELYSPLVTKQLELTDINEQIQFNGLDSKVAALDPDYWVAFTYISMGMSEDNIDVGLLSFYLFNLLKMTKYQGIFQAANVPHAYLRGYNLEAMAQSDNVVRGGLTNKYINKTLLIELIDTTPIDPVIMELGNYQVPVKDFNFKIEQFEGLPTNSRVENATIAYVIEGQGTFNFADEQQTAQEVKAQQGNAFFITAGQKFTFSGEATIAFTSCDSEFKGANIQSS